MKNELKIIWNGKKGKCFEDLICALLHCMFPQTVFKQTNYIHDGGKDFYSIGNTIEEKIWVEAKNYNKHLELSKFANTFIMADISEINRIILFSMSEVTDGAKTNIARYAAYHNKSISVYAGNDIFSLLKKYRNNLHIEKYIENTEEILRAIESASLKSEYSRITVKYEYYHAKQFNLAYRRDKENHIHKNHLDMLPLHSLIAQEVHIINKDLFIDRAIKLDCSDYKNAYIESYFYGTEPQNIVIPPASTMIIVVFFKIAETYGKIKLPTISFEDCNIESEYSGGNTECCWLGEIPYMGENWGKLQDTIQTVKLDLSKKFILIKGKSGVGKTRFLQELSGYYFQNGYRIVSLDFRSMTELSLKSTLQTILNNIYVLDESYNEKVVCLDAFGQSYKTFFNIIFDETYDCTKHIDTICSLFCSLFKRKQIVLLIDNVQDIGTDTSYFFEQLMGSINNQSELQLQFILCFNEDFLFQGKSSTLLLSYLEQLNSSYLVELFDFNKADAKLYLIECLDPRRIRLDIHTYFDEIIVRFGTNPFVLKQLVLYLKQRGIITFVDSMLCITDYINMKAVLNELPRGIEQILQYRYSHLLCNIQLDDTQHINRIIWSILFFGKLNSGFISNMKIESRELQALIDYGFIEYNENLELVFCHQLIEKSFCLFFLNNQYLKIPALTFIDDKDFLNDLFEIIEHVGKISLSIESMLLRTRLNKIETTNFNLALKMLINSSPRAIMIPLIIDSMLVCLNSGVKADPKLEFQALYALSIAAQERYDVYSAAKYTKDLIIYEQATYKDKLAAKLDIMKFFKNYVFQLPTTDKCSFLDWLTKEINDFDLLEDELQDFLAWIHNRYSKTLCSEHLFEDAEFHAQEALKIALNKNDLCSAAEAEIEYGNIFAYNDANKTADHWKNCVDYIIESGTKTIYFEVYMHGYYILSELLKKNTPSDLITKIHILQNLREKTFLYQRLFIDDVCADYYIIQYMDGNYDLQTLKSIVPQLIQMKAESYMHTPKFTILATYKLFTVYRLICDVDATETNIDKAISLIHELIKNGIFDKSKLPYSKMILSDIFKFCKQNVDLFDIILNELPETAKSTFTNMQIEKSEHTLCHAITPLSNKNREVNLLHFNYVF